MAKLNVLIQAAKLVESDEDKVPSKAKGSVRVIGLFAEETEIFEQYHNSIQSSPSSMSDSESKKGRPFGPGSREQHNRLEKNRRAEMKQFFIKLKQNVPSLEGKVKASNASILAAATSYIAELKKLDKRYESERYRLHRCRVCLEEQVKMLKEELHRQNLQNQLFAQVQQEKRSLKTPKEMASVETQANEADILAELPVCVVKQPVETRINPDSTFEPSNIENENIEENSSDTQMTFAELESFSFDSIILPRYSDILVNDHQDVQNVNCSSDSFSRKCISSDLELQNSSDDEQPDLEIML